MSMIMINRGLRWIMAQQALECTEPSVALHRIRQVVTAIGRRIRIQGLSPNPILRTYPILRLILDMQVRTATLDLSQIHIISLSRLIPETGAEIQPPLPHPRRYPPSIRLLILPRVHHPQVGKITHLPRPTLSLGLGDRAAYTNNILRENRVLEMKERRTNQMRKVMLLTLLTSLPRTTL